MSLWEHILAMFVTIVSPGNNENSQTQITYCDEICQQTQICNNKSNWQCSTPKLDKEYFTEKVSEFSKTMDNDKAEKLAKVISYTRPETYEEGLVRYQIIAQAIDKVSNELSREKCLKENTDKSLCKNKPWYGDEKSLAAFVATLIIGESRLSSNVHGGLESGLGDCFHRYKDGKTVRYCNSYGLGQMMQPALDAHKLGYKKQEIVGLDYMSTEKAVRGIAYGLIGAKGVCGYRHPKMDSYAGAFSLYGTGNNCKLKYLNDRSKTFWYILVSKKKINEDTLFIMENKSYKRLYNLLINSNKQIKYLPSVNFETIELDKFLVTN